MPQTKKVLGGVGGALAVVLAAALLSWGTRSQAFTGPSSSGGVGSGAIGTDSSNNVSVGTTTPQSTSKLLVQAPSTATSSYAVKVIQPDGTAIFSIANSGAVTMPGTFTAGSFTGTVSAGNVSSGSFGANTGGGNYSFPGSVAIGTTTVAEKLRITSGNLRFDNAPTSTAYYLLGPDGTRLRLYSPPGLASSSFQITASDGVIVQHQLAIGGGVKSFLQVLGGGLGIGTDDPQYGLDVGAPQSRFQNDVWLATASGKVGIATTSPAYPLSVVGVIYSSSGGFRFPDGTTQTTAATGGSGVTGSGTPSTLPIWTGTSTIGDSLILQKEGASVAIGSAGFSVGTTTAQTIGNIYATGVITANSFSGTVSAGNVSSGSFGANTGGGNYTFPANVTVTGEIVLNGSPGGDHAADGPTTATFNAGATVTVMDTVYMGSAGKWLLTDADATSTASGMLGISLESKTDGQAMKVALSGSFVRDDTWNWTVGGTIYLSTTAGALTQTQPVGTDDVIRVVGFAVSADVIYFNPSPDYITHT